MPVPMQYVKVGIIGDATHGHSGGIAALCFSPNGEQLASAGLDSNVCIWRMSDGVLLHTFRGTSPVLSLTWTTVATLLCGAQDGSIFAIHPTEAKLHASTFPRSHSFPVEHLAFHNARLASGAHEELAIWEVTSNGLWKHVWELEPPPTNSNNRGRDVLVTSLHWTQSRKYRSLLLVTYLYHGYVMYDTKTWTRVHSTTLNGLVAHASLTPDGTKLVVSNMMSGFDVYETETGSAICTLNHTVSRLFAVPVLFAHGGNAIITGSCVGQVHVWDALSHRTHQVLTLEDRILAIAAHYDEPRDCFILVTGNSHPDAVDPITVWFAEQAVTSTWSLRDALLRTDLRFFLMFFVYLLCGLCGGLLAIFLGLYAADVPFSMINRGR